MADDEPSRAGNAGRHPRLKEHAMPRPSLLAVLAGLAIGAIAWIDPIFIPLVLAGPVVTGAVAASRGAAFRWVALAWAIGGVSMLVSDWAVNDEDQVFHAVLTLIMVGLARGGFGATAWLRRHGTGHASRAELR
jgi:hypothetical protein